MTEAIFNLIFICAFYGGLFVLLGVIDGVMQKIFWRNHER